MLFRDWKLSVVVVLVAFATGCGGEPAVWELPDPATVAEWYGPGTEASIDGNVLEIRGTVERSHIERGGRIWARASPYFYLFNVHIRQLLLDYPDLAAVRATTYTANGVEVARALVTREGLSGPRWNEALARTSLAQQEGTSNPGLVERLTRFGEENTEYEYRGPAN